MSLISRMRKQKAVYWAPLGPDAYGQPTWGEPVEIECRWEDVSEEFIDPTGTRQVSRARVYVDRDVQVMGVLLLGGLDSSVDEDDPKANEGAWEIRQADKLPNLRATEYLRTAYL